VANEISLKFRTKMAARNTTTMILKRAQTEECGNLDSLTCFPKDKNNFKCL
jgi:hypothetical protein